MEYSDRDLLVATQIAYYDINTDDQGRTLREIFNEDSTIYDKLIDNQTEAKSELEKISKQLICIMR